MEKRVEQYYKYKKAYYEGEPLVSDAEFDEFEKRLVNDGFDPTVGYSDDSTNKIPHRHKMTSLKKIQVLTDEIDIDDVRSLENEYTCHGWLSWKYDGMAANLQYTNGVLTGITSRGNGEKGRSLYSKLQELVPQVITSDDSIDVRVEICMKQKLFDEKYSEDQKHARNLVAGIVRNERIDDPRKFDLSFIVIEAINSKQQFVKVETLGSWFAENEKEKYRVDDASTLKQLYDRLYLEKFDYEYPVDGLVFANDSEYFETDGKYPSHAKAIKFKPPVMVSTILDIEWELKKTGAYIPVAILSPIIVDGRKISKASAYNIEFLTKNKLEIGKQVRIVLSNDIIPMIRPL